MTCQLSKHDITDAVARLKQAAYEVTMLRATFAQSVSQATELRLASESIQRAILSLRLATSCAEPRPIEDAESDL